MFRFTIRDILWLTAVVALAMALQTTRFQLARQAVRFEQERAQAEQATALAIGRLQTRINELHTQNLQQEHRFQSQLAAERKLHAENLQRLKAESAAHVARINQAAALASSLDAPSEPRD